MSDTTLLERLRRHRYNTWKDDLGPEPEKAEAADRIEKLERAIELYEAERTRFRHTYPELSGQFFISGALGKTDQNLLPEYIQICPAYGCDWSQIYQRTERTTR